MAILVETIQWCPQLYEGKSGPSVRFKFAESDQKGGNANRRIYPHAVLSHSISEAQKKISEGQSLWGSCDHPAKGELSVSEISHRLTSLRMDEKNAICEASILNTDRGRNLQEILKEGSIGVSMRGTGTTRPLSGDLVEVNADHVLMGIDFVCAPSFQDAHVSAKNIYESADFSGEPEVGPNVLMKRYREARLAGFVGSLQQLEENINKIDQNDEGLMKEFLEAKASGFVGTYDQYWEQWMARHGGCDE